MDLHRHHSDSAVFIGFFSVLCGSALFLDRLHGKK
jgi:hypothetical protein